MMFWLDKLMEDFNIKTRYELSKKTGMSEVALANIVKRNSPSQNLRLDSVRKLANGLNLSLDDLSQKFFEYEKEIK